MDLKEFFTKLQLRGYENEKAFQNTSVNKIIDILEYDKESVFKAWFGEDKHERYDQPNWRVHLLQAQSDKQEGYIKKAIHYIFMQEKLRTS